MAANLFLWSFVFLSTYFAFALICYYFWRRNESRIFKCKRILFVTAHPDDECMFFAPCIIHLAKFGEVRLLCLSNGNFYGLGKIREKELQASCSLLGIKSENICVLNKTELQDNPSASWDINIITAAIHNECKLHDIDMIVTFDGYGISGHFNHISIYNAVKAIQNIPVYILESTNIVRKYISLFDLTNSILAEYVFLSSFQGFRASQKAMAAHQSQFVWFRRLYVIFSRYMIINTLKRIYPDRS